MSLPACLSICNRQTTGRPAAGRESKDSPLLKGDSPKDSFGGGWMRGAAVSKRGKILSPDVYRDKLRRMEPPRCLAPMHIGTGSDRAAGAQGKTQKRYLSLRGRNDRSNLRKSFLHRERGHEAAKCVCFR